jgi:hypothetical protein
MFLAERLGSGDGEREALMTRQMPYEPLPASVLFGAFGLWCRWFIRWIAAPLLME